MEYGGYDPTVYDNPTESSDQDLYYERGGGSVGNQGEQPLYPTGYNTGIPTVPSGSNATPGGKVSGFDKPASFPATSQPPYDSNKYQPKAAAGAGAGGATWGSYTGTTFDPFLKSGIPTYTPPAAYKAPEYNQRRVAALTQAKANPYIADLHRTILEAIAQSRGQSNPTVQKFLNEGTMKSAGSDVGKIMGQAATEGEKAYAPEYAGKVQEAQTNYMTLAQAARDTYTQDVNIYSTALQKYLSGYSGVQVSGEQMNPYGIPATA